MCCILLVDLLPQQERKALTSLLCKINVEGCSRDDVEQRCSRYHHLDKYKINLNNKYKIYTTIQKFRVIKILQRN